MAIPNNTLINTDGSIAPFDPHEHGTRLKTWQTLIGGYIEPVAIPNSSTQTALVDEEGLLKRDQDEFNITASHLLGRPILGPVLIVEMEELDRS